MRTPIFVIAVGVLLAGQPKVVSADPITFTATGTVDRVFNAFLLPVPIDSKAGDTFVVSWTFTPPLDSDPNPQIGNYFPAFGESVPGPYSITVGSTTVTGTHVGSFALVDDGNLDRVGLLFADMGWAARLSFEGIDWLTGDSLPTGLELQQAPSKSIEIQGGNEFGDRGTLVGPIRSIQSSSPAQVTPEPSTISLLAGGLAVAVGILRRRSRTRP